MSVTVDQKVILILRIGNHLVAFSEVAGVDGAADMKPSAASGLVTLNADACLVLAETALLPVCLLRYFVDYFVAYPARPVDAQIICLLLRMLVCLLTRALTDFDFYEPHAIISVYAGQMSPFVVL